MIEFNYGRKLHYMTIGNMEPFYALEKWRAFGYIIGENKYNEECYLELSFVFETREDAMMAYRAFQECIDRYDNTEEIDIIFVDDEKKEGYTAVITQNLDTVTKSIVPSHLEKWVQPIYTNMIRSKSFPRKSKEYSMLKEQKNGNNSVKVSFSYADSSRGFCPIKEASYIKKGLLFLTVEEAKDHDMLKGHFFSDEEREKNKKNMPLEKVEDIIKQRWYTLNFFYPVTIDKILVDGYLKEQIEELKEIYEETEIYQAICNLILQFRLKKSKVTFKEWSELDFLEHLLRSAETFHSLHPKDSYFCLDRIERQIKYKEKRRKN